MGRLVEFINIKPRVIQLSGPKREIIVIKSYGKMVLDEWFIKYCPDHLRVVRILDDDDISKPLRIRKVNNRSVVSAPSESAPAIKKKESKKKRRKRLVKRQKQEASRVVRFPKYRDLKKPTGLGRAVAGARSTEKLRSTIKGLELPISNGIGVGILSYNRPDSLRRLIYSIRAHTNLDKVSVFVSDESDDVFQVDWLKRMKDITFLHGERLGVAGNSNRLLRCLSRFDFSIILNDDVEILADGWENFYMIAAKDTGYHHFCYRQPGIYGATEDDGNKRINGDHVIKTIRNKPHGAVMAFTKAAFDAVGFFDESLGLYGMEHVDWSNRVSLAGLQPPGFHDIDGSSSFFRIHKVPSAAKDRLQNLSKSRQAYAGHKKDRSRIYIKASQRSVVDRVAYIVPVRDIGRAESIRTVIDCIRAQRFPQIDIILVENDTEKKLGNLDHLTDHILVKCTTSQAFQKSKSFNVAVANCTADYLILHDGDMLVDSSYTTKIFEILGNREACHIGKEVLYLDDKSTTMVNRDRRLTDDLTSNRTVGYFEGGSIACRRSAFWKIGGFNEIFEGYGMEDVDFFHRLKANTDFLDDRSVVFIHLFHSRPPKWRTDDKKNLMIWSQTSKKVDYLKHIIDHAKRTYPMAYRRT